MIFFKSAVILLELTICTLAGLMIFFFGAALAEKLNAGYFIGFCAGLVASILISVWVLVR